MAEFCIHEKHGGMCEKTDTYCNLGACPYEDLKEYAPVKRGTISVREKLVELLSQSQSYGKILCGASLMSVRNDVVADQLIDSGVTVQECGYWIKTETNSTCSKCGGNVTSWSGEYDGYERERGICLMHYCPHCGAKMTPQPPKGE